MYGNEYSHIYILPWFLGVVQISATITNIFIYITSRADL